MGSALCTHCAVLLATIYDHAYVAAHVGLCCASVRGHSQQTLRCWRTHSLVAGAHVCEPPCLSRGTFTQSLCNFPNTNAWGPMHHEQFAEAVIARPKLKGPCSNRFPIRCSGHGLPPTVVRTTGQYISGFSLRCRFGSSLEKVWK